MENKPKRKATRRIKKFDFSDEKATVSLVGESVGGPANGYTTLLTKSNKQVSEEFLRKASEITVTMEITEYLQRFFGIWERDAELLARSLGFTTKGMEKAQVEMQEEELEANQPAEYPSWDDEPGDEKYEKWINEKLQSISVMKNLYTTENLEDALMQVSEEDYIAFLQDQEVVEKALLKLESESVEKSAGDATSDNIVHEVKGGDKTPVVKQKEKGKVNMTDKVQTIEQEVEVIAKSEFESIQKAFEAQKEELQKALDLVNELKKEKQEAIAKARSAALTDAIKDQAKAEVILKAMRQDVTEDEFVAVVKALADMTAQIEKSEMFSEKGVSTEEESVKEDPLTRLIKSKYSK